MVERAVRKASHEIESGRDSNAAYEVTERKSWDRE